MPWVNLTQEEVDELRTKKHELTEYGKQRLKELTQQGISKYSEALKLMKDQEPYPDAMFEEAERREAERKALDALDKLYDENGDAMKQLTEIEKEERERPFYRFFAIEYFATGEGMSFWLKVCRNYPPHNDRDYDLERFAKFIGEGAAHYLHGLETPTQEEFLEKYANLIPPYIVKMIERRDQPGFDWETHLYFNYS